MIKNAFLARVIWRDPCFHPRKEKEAFIGNSEALLATQENIGYAVYDGDNIVVINNVCEDKTDPRDNEYDVTVIPKGLIKTVEKLKPVR